MRISKVYYQKNFRTGDFLYENIGVGIEINDQEDPKEALDEAKKLCQEYHNEHIQQELEHQSQQPEPTILPSIQVEKDYKDMSFEEQIESCDDLKVLESYKLLANRTEHLQTVYDRKHWQLKQAAK